MATQKEHYTYQKGGIVWHLVYSWYMEGHLLPCSITDCDLIHGRQCFPIPADINLWPAPTKKIKDQTSRIHLARASIGSSLASGEKSFEKPSW